MQAILPLMLPSATVSLRYPVRPSLEAWVLPEGTVPEAPIHDQLAERLKLLLGAWAQQRPSKTRIARNLALRFYEQDQRLGIDPDICVLAPPPDDLDELGSVCLWKPDHTAPPLCIEIVSTTHPNKDYSAVQDRYAALGTHELIIFDPTLAGPKSLGGPVALQLWRRDTERAFERLCFGDEPVYSEVLSAWLIAEGSALHIADDRAGARRWLTEAERYSREANEARAEANEARARVEALEREVMELTARAAKP